MSSNKVIIIHLKLFLLCFSLKKRVCTGTWSDKDQELIANPIVVVVVAISMILHTIMSIAIRSSKPVEAPQNNYQIGTSTNLASELAGDLFSISLFLIIAAYFATIR